MAVFDVGDLVRVSASFVGTTGSTADPTTVYCKYKRPDGTSSSATYGEGVLLKIATGVYYTDINIDKAGTWYYRFWSGSAGTGQAAGESLFQVRKQNVT
jgi:hypothetical protein